MSEEQAISEGIVHARASSSPRQVMRNPSFRKLWVGQAISQFGDGFYWLAIMLGLSDLTGGDIRAIGLVSMAFMLPQLPIGIFGTPLVDRVNRRRLMIVADLLRVVTTLACIGAYVARSPLMFYMIAFVQSSISGFFIPAKNAIIPQIVSRDDLLSANALSQTTQVAALIFGPALAGFTIDHWGIPLAFVVDALTFLLSALFIWWMAPVPTLGSGKVTLRQAWHDLSEGLTFALRSATVRNVTLVVSMLFLGLGAINVLWIPFMQRVFGLGAQEIGFVDAAQGVGMLMGALLMESALLRHRPPHVLLLGGIGVASLTFIATGLAPSYLFILGVTLVLGVIVPPAQAAFMTLIQYVTPHQLLGRVNGAVGAVTNGTMLVSMALAATFAEGLGLRESYVVCGLLGVLAVVVGLFILRTPETGA